MTSVSLGLGGMNTVPFAPLLYSRPMHREREKDDDPPRGAAAEHAQPTGERATAGPSASGSALARAEPSDAAELTRRIHAGESEAEGELVARYGRGIRFLLRRLTRDPARADDLYQETFRVVIERLRSRPLENPGGLAAFLQGTARKLHLNASRKIQRRKTETAGDALPETTEPAPSPLGKALRSEQARQVRRLLAELEPERDRLVLYRFYLVEEDKGSICADLELSHLHFNRVLHRARSRFKRLLEAETNTGSTGEGQWP